VKEEQRSRLQSLRDSVKTIILVEGPWLRGWTPGPAHKIAEFFFIMKCCGEAFNPWLDF
jgi:hypothetical protein